MDGEKNGADEDEKGEERGKPHLRGNQEVDVMHAAFAGGVIGGGDIGELGIADSREGFDLDHREGDILEVEAPSISDLHFDGIVEDSSAIAVLGPKKKETQGFVAAMLVAPLASGLVFFGFLEYSSSWSPITSCS